MTGQGEPRRFGLSQGWHCLLLVLMGTIWGLQFAMLKLAAESGHSEIDVVTVALALISIFFGALLVLRRGVFRPSRDVLVFMIVTSLLGYVAPLVAILYAAPHVSAGVLALIAAFTPVVTLLVALLLRSETVSRRRILAMGLGMASAVLVLAPGVEFGGGPLQWLVLAFVVPLCYGVESVYVAVRWPKTLDTFQVVAGEAVMATIFMLPVYLAFGGDLGYDPRWPTSQLAIAIFVAGGIVEVLLYFHLIRRTGGVLVSFGTFVSLIAGILWGIALFSETHGAAVWIAALLLLVALALIATDRTVVGRHP